MSMLPGMIPGNRPILSPLPNEADLLAQAIAIGPVAAHRAEDAVFDGATLTCPDLSVNDKPLYQSISVRQPAQVDGYLAFDNNNDYMRFDRAVNQPCEVYAITIPSLSSSTSGTLWDGPDGQHRRMYWVSGNPNLTTNGTNRISTTYPDALTEVHAIRATYNGASSGLAIGGNSVTGDVGSNGLDQSFIVLGCYGSLTTSFSDQGFFEWWWFDKVLSTVERTYLNEYFAFRYPGLTLVPPS